MTDWPDCLVTVRELIEILGEFPPDLPVLVPRDPEGNGYFWCRGAFSGDEPAHYAYVVAEDVREYHVEAIYDEQEIAELLEDGEDLAEVLGQVYVRIALVEI